MSAAALKAKMAGDDKSILKCIKLALAACGLMLYELIFFIAFVSLSIGSAICVKSALRLVFGIDLHISLETFCSWYVLASSTQVHLRLYRKFIYSKFKVQLRLYAPILQGFPRIVYFILYCLSVYGIYYEYEAVHGYKPYRLANSTTESTVIYHRHGLRHRHARRIRPITDPDAFPPEAPNERIHTALFLAMMSYIIYSSGQVLCLFMMRLSRTVPPYPVFPQFYATFTMLIMQAIVTVFYAFPLIMTLIACHMFRVDGVSTYMFSLCLAMLIALAAAQLESESPFPTEPRMGPYYYFEGQYRARINLIFAFLPTIAYYYFERARSYPLLALDRNFTLFTFWFMLCLLHTVKSLYLTTWRPINAGQVAPVQQPEQNNYVPDQALLFHADQPNRDEDRMIVAVIDPNLGQRVAQMAAEESRRMRISGTRASNNNTEEDTMGTNKAKPYVDETWNELEEHGSNSGSNRKKLFGASTGALEVQSVEGPGKSEVKVEGDEVSACFEGIGSAGVSEGTTEVVKNLHRVHSEAEKPQNELADVGLVDTQSSSKQREDIEGNLEIECNSSVKSEVKEGLT